MRFSLLFIFLFLCIKSYSQNSVHYDSFRNDSIIKSSPFIVDTLRNKFGDYEPIPTIHYEITFYENRKQNYRNIQLVKNSIFIDVENDIVYEEVVITYEPDYGYNYEANLEGEELSFSIHPLNELKHELRNKLSIIAIDAKGWSIGNSNSLNIFLRPVRKVMFNNTIRIYLKLDNQSVFKGRKFTIYNKGCIPFQTNLKISKEYDFTRFDETLPIYFKIPNNRFDLFNGSQTIMSHIINNEIFYEGFLLGNETLSDDLRLYGKIPWRQINFDYSFDYKKDLDSQIIKENRILTKTTLDEINETSNKSSNLSLILFTFSTVIALYLFYLSLNKKSKKRMNRFFFSIIEFFKQKKLESDSDEEIS